MTPTRSVDSVALKLGAFAVVLTLAFLVAFGVGSAVGPLDEAPATTTSVPAGVDRDDHAGEHGS